MEAAAIVRDHAKDGATVVCRGSGTKQDWGSPCSREHVWIDTRSLTGVVEHAAGDLVVVVRAGTLMAELQEVLAKAGQQLAIDPGFADATVGGTVAANVSGPRRMAYGTLRDLLIGITVVRPDGVIARSGGKVVKNVAGYDLAKLFAGSYGTLGLITECAFRLHPIPMGTASVSAAFADAQEAEPAIAAVLRSQLAPTELEVAAAPGEPVTVMARFDGHAAELRAAGAG
ncbi:MAG: FAD-binding oxidoreductase, partial [Dehalococcoidia bacterium]